MNNTTDTTTTTTAQTWRDYAGQLTAEQVAQFEAFEVAFPPDDRDWMLTEARELVERNTADAELFGKLPVPEGAVKVFLADRDDDGGGWCREFDGTERKAGPVNVFIGGYQDQTGDVIRTLRISVDGEDHSPIMSMQARELAAALIEAADEYERLVGGAR